MYLYEIRNNKKLKKDYLASWKRYILPIIRNKYFRNPNLFIEKPKYRSHVYDHNQELKKFLLIQKDLGSKKNFIQNLY